MLKNKLEQIQSSLNDTSSQIRNVKSKRIAVISVLLLCVVICVICCLTFGNRLVVFFEDGEAFKAWIDSFGHKGKIIFVLIRTVQTVIKIIPCEPLEIAAGYAFGTIGGTFYCLLGSFLGSLVIIALTKKFGIKLVELFVSKKKIDSLVFLKNKKNLNITLFIIYLIPSTPKDIIIYLIALTDENIPLFLLITTIGRIPSVITSTWCGSEIEKSNYLLALIIFGATAVLCCIGTFAYRKISDKKTDKA